MPREDERTLDPLPDLGGPRVDDLLGNLDLGAGDGGLEGGVAEGVLGAVLECVPEPMLDVGAKLPEGVEVGVVGGEVVVEVGQRLLAHLLDLDREDRVLAGELLGPVLVGEGDLDRALLARRGAGQGLVEPLDELARSRARAGSRSRSRPRMPRRRSRRRSRSGGSRPRRRRARRSRGPRGSRAGARSPRRRPRRGPRARPCRPRGPCTRPASPSDARPTSIVNSSASPSAGGVGHVELRVADRA